MTPKDQLLAAYGGIDAVARFKDGSTLAVKVRDLTGRELIHGKPSFLDIAHIDIEVIAACTELTEDQIDMLTDESEAELADLGRERNFQRALHRAKREIRCAAQFGFNRVEEQIAEAMTPHIKELEKRLLGVLRESQSSSGSPSTPPLTTPYRKPNSSSRPMPKE